MDIVQNQSFTFSPAVEARDSGWIISGSIATHYPCNPGTMKSNGSDGLVVGLSYVVTYEVIDLISGSVRVNLGNTQGTSRTANGIYTETLQVTGFAGISFYSDGYLTINDNLKFYEFVDTVDNSITVSFYDKEGTDRKKWSSRYSYSPEMFANFMNSLFTIKNGQLWKHNVNEVRNNFYGIQYVSQIQFYGNLNPTTVKLYYSMRVQSTSRWFCPTAGDISILPVVGRVNGMSSRLKRNNFQNYQGSFYADFMRNFLDERFHSPVDALYKGEELRGRIMDITVTNDDTTEAVLFEIDIKTSISNYTY